MDEEELRVFCSDLVAELGIQPPLSPALLCRRLSEYRGRPVKLQAADLGTTTSIGHLVAQRTKDRILYERTAPRGQQTTVIYHEVIHLVRDHLDGQNSLTCGTLAGDSHGDYEVAPLSLYSTWQEWEAETGALILLEMSRVRLHPNHIAIPGRSPEQGVAAAFGLKATPWR